MKKLLMAAITVVTVAGSTAGAAEFPSFELQGFSITRHHVAVLGAQGVQEQSAPPTLMFGGMPASPHQIAVLTPRPEMAAKGAEVKPTTVGLATE
jgi:hypothetical protein